MTYSSPQSLADFQKYTVLLMVAQVGLQSLVVKVILSYFWQRAEQSFVALKREWNKEIFALTKWPFIQE